jgi:hypothetical protein
MTDQERAGVGFWAAVVLFVALAYPLSFGPWCWAYSRATQPNYFWGATHFIYSPLLRVWLNVASDDQGRIAGAIGWYANLGARGNVTIGAFDDVACLITYSDPP